VSEHDVTDEQPEEQAEAGPDEQAEGHADEQAEGHAGEQAEGHADDQAEDQPPEELKAEGEGDGEADADEDRREEPQRDGGPRRGGGGGARGPGASDRIVPLRKLVELAAKYPEVGPPLAELAFAIGESEVGNQLVRLGTDREAPHIEYWFVAANAARREKRYDEVISIITQAVRSVASRTELEAGEEERLLHLVRMGFATLMFDLQQLTADAEFVQAMSALLPALDAKLGHLPFYRTLMAQTLWFADREASEREWNRADELGDAEATWNARGTWYHQAEKDLDKAERAYRKGLDKAGQSALLLHNTAQILVEKAKRPGIQPNEAHRYLNQAVEMLRTALRQDAPRLRRHIHSTRDRLEELRRTLPPAERRGGDRPPRYQGGGGYQGGGYQGGGGPRPQGAGGPGPRRDARPPGPGGGGGGPRPPRQGGGGPRQDRPPREQRPVGPEQKFLVEGKMSLGEMILAKLKEKEAK
jgi:tetratricopeptide (TPR) repeat protein